MTASELAELAARVEAGSGHDDIWASSVEWKWCQYTGETSFTVQRIVTADYAKFPHQSAALAFIAEQKRLRALAAQQQDRQTEGDSNG